LQSGYNRMYERIHKSEAGIYNVYDRLAVFGNSGFIISGAKNLDIYVDQENYLYWDYFSKCVSLKIEDVK